MPMSIIILIIVVLVTVFAVQNAAPVMLSFLFWTFQSSLAIVILLSTVMGVVLASVVFMLLRLKRAMRTKGAAHGQSEEAAKKHWRIGAGDGECQNAGPDPMGSEMS